MRWRSVLSQDSQASARARRAAPGNPLHLLWLQAPFWTWRPSTVPRRWWRRPPTILYCCLALAFFPLPCQLLPPSGAPPPRGRTARLESGSNNFLTASASSLVAFRFFPPAEGSGAATAWRFRRASSCCRCRSSRLRFSGARPSFARRSQIWGPGSAVAAVGVRACQRG